MKEFSFASMRHGHKLPVGETQKPLEQSNLTEGHQSKWREAVERLGGEDPEIIYENLPLIEIKAKELFGALPSHATVLIATSRYPRAKILADFLTGYLLELNDAHLEKDLNVAFLWEPMEIAKEEESISNIANIESVARDITALMEKIQKQEHLDDALFSEYFSQDGNRTHPNEEELVRKAINEDLASPYSVYKKRAEILKHQLKRVRAVYADLDRPLYCLVIGHHSNLVALDVAFNNRHEYISVDEIPKPLTLWSVPAKKLDDLLSE